jgi:hypothetical protein
MCECKLIQSGRGLPHSKMLARQTMPLKVLARGGGGEFLFEVDDFLDLGKEPAIDFGQ